MKRETRDKTKALTEALIKSGQLIEAGWQIYRATCVPAGASQVQIDATRDAFWMGAQHLWGSIRTGLTPDQEPTAEDDRRMELISIELDSFAAVALAKMESEGNA